jgi:glycosyltransferase involved in cell wall biosynthesis
MIDTEQNQLEKTQSADTQPRPIAVMIGQLTQGGSERQLYAFLAHCDRNRWAPVVYVSGELGFWEEHIRKLGIPVVLLRGNQLAKMWQFRRACISQKAKHFFSWSSYTNAFGLALLGRDVRRIGSFRNAGFSDLPSRQRWLWSWMSLAGISTAVCNSRGTKTELSARCGSTREVVFVPNAVDVFPSETIFHWRREWRKQLGLSETDILVLGVGRIEPAKQFPRFVDAVHETSRHISVQAVIAGEDQGGLDEVQLRIAQFNLNGSIRLIGRVPDARELIAAADIFLLSSDREGMPNVLLEAMASGIACVATNVGAVGDVIEHGTNGFVVHKNASELAKYVIRLAKDPGLRRSVGEKARATVKQNYQADQLVHELWALCEPGQ